MSQRNKIGIPLIGLGTFKLRANVDKDLVYNVLDTALSVGYRHIDTASCYRNEEDIGDALQKLYEKHGLTRSDLFITSKVPPKDMSFGQAKETCLKTLKDLQCDYVDAYLIHWPGKAKLKPDDKGHADARKETWRVLEELKADGCIRHIGVSNFTRRHLEELLTYANVKPVINQVEFHAHLSQKELLEYCCANEIFLQSYSTLGTGLLLGDEKIGELASKYERNVAQILLKWAVQQGVGVIPKSLNSEHIKSNFMLDDFMISEEDMEVISELSVEKHYCWDPTLIK